MKIYDFGLWFQTREDRQWMSNIPIEGPFSIWYDGEPLGWFSGCDGDGDGDDNDFNFSFYKEDKPHIIKLKKDFHWCGWCFQIGRQLIIDDFEIIPNPDYKGIK